MAAVASSSSAYHVTYPSSPASMSIRSSVPAYEPPPPKAQFAFAQINGGIYLVQVLDTVSGDVSSALAAADVHIFRHEFITQFRFSHSASVHPAELRILESIDDAHTLYEADKGTVFLARDLMARLQKLTTVNANAAAQRSWRRPRVAGQISRSH